jgi:hypothetical protein
MAENRSEARCSTYVTSRVGVDSISMCFLFSVLASGPVEMLNIQN